MQSPCGPHHMREDYGIWFTEKVFIFKWLLEAGYGFDLEVDYGEGSGLCLSEFESSAPVVLPCGGECCREW